MSNTRRIAVVDGYSTGRYLADRLHALGADCIHISSQEDMPSLFTNGWDPSLYSFDLGFTRDVGNLVTKLQELDIADIVPGTESGVLLADRLKGMLAIPGNDPSLSIARRDKHAMAHAASAAGIRVPATTAVCSAAQAVEWLRGSRFHEIVAKPPSSAGGDNVHFCHDEETLAAAVERILSAKNLFGRINQKAVIQERLNGTECYVNSVSVDGAHSMTEMWGYRKMTLDGRTVYDYEEPLDPASQDAMTLQRFVIRVLDVLGIRHGAAHTEVMLTADGPALIETGARLGGSTLPWVSEKFSGTSQALALASVLARPGEVPPDVADWAVRIRMVNLINRTSGIARDLGWVNQPKTLPTAVALLPAVAPGTYIPATTDLSTSPGLVYFAHQDIDAIEGDYTTLRHLEHSGLYTCDSGS